MDKVKKFAVGAGIAFGAAYVSSYVAKKSLETGATLKPDSVLVKFAGPLSGGVIAVAAHFAGLL